MLRPRWIVAVLLLTVSSSSVAQVGRLATSDLAIPILSTWREALCKAPESRCFISTQGSEISVRLFGPESGEGSATSQPRHQSDSFVRNSDGQVVYERRIDGQIVDNPRTRWRLVDLAMQDSGTSKRALRTVAFHVPPFNEDHFVVEVVVLGADTSMAIVEFDRRGSLAAPQAEAEALVRSVVWNGSGAR